MVKLRSKLPNGSASPPLFSRGFAAVWLLVALVVEIGYGSLLRESRDAHLEAARMVARDPLIRVSAAQMKVVHAVSPNFENDFVLDFMRKTDRSEVELSQAAFDKVAETASSSLNRHPFRQFGLVPVDRAASGFATHVFVHEGIPHLIATLYLLMLAAPLLEKRWGSWMLALTSLLIVLASAGAYAFSEPESQRALAGGSALIAGLVAAVLVRPRQETIYFFGRLPIPQRFKRIGPSWSLGCVWLVYEASLSLIAQGALPSGIDNTVGYTAHAAAALLGGGLSLAWGLLGIERPMALSEEEAAEAALRKVVRFDLNRVLDLKAKGDVDAAFHMLDHEVERRASNRDVVMAYWHMAIELGQIDHAAPVLARLIEEEIRRGADAVAIELRETLREHAPGVLLHPATLLRLLPALGKEHGEEEVVIALRQALDENNRGLTPLLAASIAMFATEIDPRLASQAARTALSAKNLDDKIRAEMKMLVAALAPSKSESSEPQKQNQKQDTPNVDVHFAASDRSAFGQIGDLSEMADDSFPDGAISLAVPVGSIPEGLSLEIDGAEATIVEFTRMRAMAIVGVHGLGEKPVALLDILIDGSGDTHPLTVLRMRCDQFDPLVLVPDAKSSAAAMKVIVQTLAGQGVRVLADITADSSEAKQFFQSIEDYHDKILRPVASQFA